MHLIRTLKSIIYMFLILIVGVFILGVIFFFLLGYLGRERILSESLVNSVVENPDSGLKSKIVLRHYYTGGLDGAETYNWFLIVENNEGERFESVIPHWNAGLSKNEMRETELDLSWVNQYKLMVKSLKWPGIIWNAYFISDYLHIFDKERDSLLSNINETPIPLSEEFIKKLELLELDKDILKNLKYIDLSGYEKSHGGIINEDPCVLLYLKNNPRLSCAVLSLGPILIEGECGLITIVSSQWVFYNNAFPDYLEVYADHVFVNSSDDEYFKSLNTTPIILTDKK